MNNTSIGYLNERYAHRLQEPDSLTLLGQMESTPVQVGERDLRTSFVRSQGASAAAANPILLLHGFDSSILEFRRLFPRLAPQRETWAVDLLGFGFSDRSVPTSPEAIQQHLYEFWRQILQQRSLILVGASMGGAAALDFTLRYPEAVQQLILLDSAGVQPGPVIGKFLFPPLDRWAVEFLRRPDVRRSISRNAYANPDRFVTEDAEACAALHLEEPNWAESLKSFTKSGGYPSFRARLPQIQTQTLVVWGEQDKIVGTKDAEVFQRSLANSRLVWIPESGHVPHLEKPEETAQAILSDSVGDHSLP